MPKFLLKAIQNACEEFRVVTYTVHGDDEKARISIMFSNSDCKQVKRKSVATVRRDNKRMKEFNNSKYSSNATNDVDNSDSNPGIEVLADNTNVKTVHSVADCEPSMEIESVPNCASLSADENTIGENIERSNDRKVNSTKPVKPVVTTPIEVHKQKEKVINSKSDSSEQCNNIESSVSKKDVTLEKIVLKKSRMDADRLIGKCSNGRLITFNVHQKVFDILDESDGRYEWYKQCVEHDFKDVRDTMFYTFEMEENVDKLYEFLERLNN